VARLTREKSRWQNASDVLEAKKLVGIVSTARFSTIRVQIYLS